MLVKDTRSLSEKVLLFRSRFKGLEHVYGTYDPRMGRCWQVKQPVSDSVVLNHLTGRRPLGLYFLTGTHTRALVVDYDVDDANAPLDLVSLAAHYGIPAYIEKSKQKGFHVWVLFSPPGVTAAKARAVALHILGEAGHKAEVFPKQDAIDLSRGEYGNFINLPFFGPLVALGRTVFVEPKHGLKPARNQWDYLEQMNLVSESVLDDIIAANEIAAGPNNGSTSPLILGTVEPAWTLPPCARRMLEEGVTDFQRVACFRLAILLRRIGMPMDLVAATLMAWRDKNRPARGKGRLTDPEVRSQAAYAFARDYRGYGCDEPAVAPFCFPECGVRKHHGLGKSGDLEKA